MEIEEIFVQLKSKWKDYKLGESNGKTREQLKPLEEDIIKLQGELSKKKNENPPDIYDFTKRWANKEPKIDKEYTTAKAEEEVTDKEFEEWKPYFKKAMAIKKLAVEFIEKEDRLYKDNPAATGQIVNMGFFLKLEDDKRKNEVSDL